MLRWALRAVAGEPLLSKTTRSRAYRSHCAHGRRGGACDSGCRPSAATSTDGLVLTYSEALDLAEILWHGLTAGDPGERSRADFYSTPTGSTSAGYSG